MKKLLILLLFIFTFTFIVVHFSYSQDASQEQKTELEKKIQEYQNKLNELNQQKNTLASQIQYMDAQINIATYRIQQTEEKITTTQKEIEILGDKITNLDTSLNHISKLLLQRIVEGYKKRSVSLFRVFFDSGNANDFLSQIKYLKTAQENNQKLLVQVQGTKYNFEEQKKLREQKKIDLDKLNTLLNQQKISLNSQKSAKQTLLEVTRNDETTYQGLLEKARQELAGFTAFTRSFGGGLTSFGNGSNGWYFTQRDPQWGNMNIGNSPYSVWQAGCALTSVAMVCKSYGQNITPSSMASDTSRFIYGDLLNRNFSCDGKSQTWVNVNSKDEVKSYVDRNIPVILRISAASVSGLHFIVVWGWNQDKNDFKMHDPYFGPDMNFSDQYSWSQVTTGIAIY